MLGHADLTIADLAARQRGVVARWQLRAAGIRADAVARRVLRGGLVEVSARVVRVAGAPDDDLAELAAAVLDAGPSAATSHETAAARWGLPGFRLRPISVIALRDRDAPAPLAIIHRPRHIRDGHVVELDGVPTTSPTRTIFDLASTRSISTGRLERAIDTALSRRLVSIASLNAMLDEIGGRGRAGTLRMRELLEDRPASYRPPESNLEAAFEKLARGAGFLDLERQVELGSDDAWIGRVDFIDRRRRVVFEIGDALFHGSLTDQRRDIARHEALRAAGLRVEVIAAFDVFHRRDDLRLRLRKLLIPDELVA